MALSNAEDRNAIARIVKGNVEYDYASRIVERNPIYNSHPNGPTRRDISRNSKLRWSPRTRRGTHPVFVGRM